jgi:phosphatidylserine/phosphatidylglycerophosphate/cardiolipin synthase-like enzyme/uncharacterized membrane protein YdjX (TVP38/TMEM64 family)
MANAYTPEVEPARSPGVDPTDRRPGRSDGASPLLAPGRNVWRQERAGRVAFLVDAADYYQALSAALDRAQHQVLILAWDIDSRVELPHPSGRGKVRLLDLLGEIVEKRPRLSVHILCWDFSTIYFLERELLPLVRFGYRTPKRIHFHLDDAHPVYAAHHQKVVVVDDAVAFSGGLDITVRRWDTPEHQPRDARRLGPDGELYAPFHDVQIAVDGEAATALGDLARERWRRATRHALPRPPRGMDAWPAHLAAEVTDVDVGIARTEPELPGKGPVREVEALFLDSIASAKRTLYFENQYISSPTIARALAARLEEPDGPEVVIVCPTLCSGWLEESTMGRLRGRFLRTLSRANLHDRLRLLYPKSGEDTPVYVHSKVMIVDDDLIRVGSANLSNRSLAVDTECDVVIEATNEHAHAAARALRHRLVAEHLGVASDVMAEAERRHGSLRAAIDALSGGERTLEPLQCCGDGELVPTVAEIADPEKPLSGDRLLDVFLPDEHRPRTRRPLLATAGVLIVLLTAAAMWRFTPLSAHVAPAQVAASFEPLASSPLAPFAVIAAFVVLGMCMVPVNALILATGMAFGPVLGPTYALLGALASAGAGWAAGRSFGTRLLRRLASRRIARLARSFSRRGLFAVLAVRLVPIAPYTVANLAAGAARVRALPFFAGTLLGMLPGVLLLTIVGQQLLAVVRATHPAEIAAPAVLGLSVLVVALLFGSFIWHRLQPPAAETQRSAPC